VCDDFRASAPSVRVHVKAPSQTTCMLSHLGVCVLQVYAELRRESAISHGMPIAVRHLESIIRMSEASAMMHLREYVNEEDVNVAIR